MPGTNTYRDTILSHLRTAFAEVEAADDEVAALLRQPGAQVDEAVEVSQALVRLVRDLGEVQARVSRW